MSLTAIQGPATSVRRVWSGVDLLNAALLVLIAAPLHDAGIVLVTVFLYGRSRPGRPGPRYRLIADIILFSLGIWRLTQGVFGLMADQGIAGQVGLYLGPLYLLLPGRTLVLGMMSRWTKIANVFNPTPASWSAYWRSLMGSLLITPNVELLKWLPDMDSSLRLKVLFYTALSIPIGAYLVDSNWRQVVPPGTTDEAMTYAPTAPAVSDRTSTSPSASTSPSKVYSRAKGGKSTRLHSARSRKRRS